MLKVIGLCFMILGLSFFIFTFFRGKRGNILSEMAELKMITSSGYVAEHKAEEKKASPFEGQSPIKKAPKKRRVLSEEERRVLEQVEAGRAKEKAASEKSGAMRKGTDTLPGNFVNAMQSLGTAAQAKGTDVLPASPSPEREVQQAPKNGTDVLTSHKREGTAVLHEQKTGTAVLQEEKKRTDVLVGKKGTAVLVDPPKKGTAVLQEPAAERRKGTAVLPGGTIDEEAVSKRGTDVLKGGN